MTQQHASRFDSISATNPPGTKYLWVAYTLFLFIVPIFERRPHLWSWTLISLAIFLPMYFLYFSTCNRRVKLSIYFLIVLEGALTMPWNAGGTTFMIYAACFLPFIVQPIRWVLAGFLFELAIMAAEAGLLHAPGFRLSWINVAINGFLMVVIAGGNIFFAQQKRSDKKLLMKQGEIEALAAVAERERIARDLHDVLGHTLSLIALKAELAGRLLEAGSEERARSEISDVEHTARTALAEVREAIGGYRTRGLAAEIESSRKMLAAAGIDLQTEAANMDGLNLAPADETVLCLALREAATNIVRHANAHTCTLQLLKEDGHCRLIVHDDGSPGDLREGNGLRGMRERVEALGGRLLLQRDAGTRLQVELPAPSPRGVSV